MYLTNHPIARVVNIYFNVKYTFDTDVYSELGQTSKMEHFAKIVQDFQSLTIFTKCSFLDIWQGSVYAFVKEDKEMEQVYKSNTSRKIASGKLENRDIIQWEVHGHVGHIYLLTLLCLCQYSFLKCEYFQILNSRELLYYINNFKHIVSKGL